MMIEQNTNYAYKLKYMDNPTFDKVRDLSTKFYRELPQALQDELFEALNRGIDILDSEPQMTTYLFAFGKMHQAKLNYAFGKLPKEFFEQPEINIIDYGCGQALGTMCYADFLREKGYAQNAKTITLIEPSEICLKRAALHASVFFPEAEIKTINKKFDDLTQDDIYCDLIGPTLHIFSNVLDMLSFDLDRFAELLKGCWKDYYELGCYGYDQFVCVGPFFNYSSKDGRMDDFISLLDGKEGFRETFDKYEFDPEKSWTAQILCFSIGDLEEIGLPEDAENMFRDDWGVVYSKDGKRLLRCENNIESYSIKEGTTTICDIAFLKCVTLKEVIIPDTVKSIGVCAFSGCSSLRQIKFPKSLSSIGDEAFSGCSSLTQLLIPPTWSLGNYVFSKCTSLKQVLIPDFTISEKEGVFYGCESLQQVFIDSDFRVDPDSNTWFDFCQGSIGEKAFYDCSSLRQIYIPNSIAVISERAFENCDSLVAFRTPWDLIFIGEEAFKGCFSLEEVNITNPDCTIRPNAFNCGVWMDPIPFATKCFDYHGKQWNEALRRIIIPEGTIERFKKMLEERLWDKIVELSDKESVSSFNPNKELESLSTKVTYEDRVNEVADGYVRYSEDGNKLLCYNYPRSFQPETITIKRGTRIICNQAFGHSDDCKLKQVIIPDSVTHIGEKAFEDCKCLEQINIPDSILSIGNLAFKGCEKLKQVTIPQSVKHIGDNPFITPAVITSNSERFIIKNDMLIDLYEQRLICYLGGDTDVVIPETIITIGNFAFYCCNIEHVTIPDSVISIGDYAFADCPLQNFVISKSIIHIGKNPFDNCGVGEETLPWEPNEKRPSLNILSYSERFSALNDMLIDRTQHRLITYFGNDSIIRIPEGITYIGDSAFSWCLSIKQIIIPDTVTSIGIEAFGGCENLCHINLPNGISTIEEGTFACCFNLQQITIPNTVKSIGQWAFASCPITQINLPKSIEFIGWRIFQGCHSLKRVIIPKGTKEKFEEMLLPDRPELEEE